MYARAFLEGRFTQQQVENFRHELRDAPGLSSYPHPWLMPEFWRFPTVSMGLGPLNAVYQARFMRYLEHRGLIPERHQVHEASDRPGQSSWGDGTHGPVTLLTCGYLITSK